MGAGSQKQAQAQDSNSLSSVFSNLALQKRLQSTCTQKLCYRSSLHWNSPNKETQVPLQEVLEFPTFKLLKIRIHKESKNK